MRPRFEFGDPVRVVRTLRDDGTFPGADVGDILVREGTVGHVRNVGSFLQDQIIYAVHFVALDRTVGCREEELIGVDEPWVPARFIYGEKVVNRIPLAVQGRVVVEAGRRGEVLKVVRVADRGASYHVLFESRLFLVPEPILDASEAQP